MRLINNLKHALIEAHTMMSLNMFSEMHRNISPIGDIKGNTLLLVHINISCSMLLFSFFDLELLWTKLSSAVEFWINQRCINSSLLFFVLSRNKTESPTCLPHPHHRTAAMDYPPSGLQMNLFNLMSVLRGSKHFHFHATDKQSLGFFYWQFRALIFNSQALESEYKIKKDIFSFSLSDIVIPLSAGPLSEAWEPEGFISSGLSSLTSVHSRLHSPNS